MSHTVEQLAQALRSSRGVAHKRDIAGVMRKLSTTPRLPAMFGGAEVRNGDDCAAIPDPSADGWLLLAIEGFINEFVAAEPWFAGYCGVMVNVSDIYAMGGRPIAVVDALWSDGDARAQTVLAGMAAAAQVYGVPVVGGHSNARCDREQLSVAILGRAQRLLSSFDARPGDVLLAAIDLRGSYRDHFSNWDASSGREPARLRGDLELLPKLAEDGLCRAAKDISQAGVLGTLLMLLECSGVGATIDIDAVPRPSDAELERWLLQTFPSFGFLLAVAPEHVDAVKSRFHARDLSCAVIGQCDDSRQMHLRDGTDEALAWDFRQHDLIGCGPEHATQNQAVLDPADAQAISRATSSGAVEGLSLPLAGEVGAKRRERAGVEAGIQQLAHTSAALSPGSSPVNGRGELVAATDVGAHDDHFNAIPDEPLHA